MYVFRHRSWLVGLVGASAAVLAALGACLPTLAPIGAADAAADAEITLFSGCGDGFIETLDDGGDAGESCDPGDASVIGCESCRFVCSGAIDEVGHCYFVVEDTTDFGVASTACAVENAHVVTLASQREAAFVSALVDGGAHWVGLSRASDLKGEPYAASEVQEPGWPRSIEKCSGCFAVGADAATNAFGLHPDARDAAASDLNCVVAEDGRWLATTCSGPPKKTICEREPVGQRQFFCGGAYCTNIAATAGRKRYVISIDEATAEEAAEECRLRYASENGKLVVFETREEREQLVREILTRFSPTAQTPFTFWIGLSAPTDGGPWAWDDGVVDGTTAPARPFEWGASEPATSSGSRAFIYVTARARVDQQLAYADDAGTTKRGYVCQRSP